MFFRWPFPSTTETDLMPNSVVGDSERFAVESKKWEGFRKPNTERPPSRISETEIGGASMSLMSRVGDPAGSTSGIVADLWWSADSGRIVSWAEKLKNPKSYFCSLF